MCWYLNFLVPGSVCDMTYKLSSSDWFGEFCHWSRMPLTKVEQLVDIFINRGYVQPSCLLLRRDEFCESVELLITLLLYLLGPAPLFARAGHCARSPHQRFVSFFWFLDCFVDMHVECIKHLNNMGELNKVMASYKSVGDVVHANVGHRVNANVGHKVTLLTSS